MRARESAAGVLCPLFPLRSLSRPGLRALLRLCLLCLVRPYRSPGRRFPRPPALPAGKGACLRLRRGLRACGRALSPVSSALFVAAGVARSPPACPAVTARRGRRFPLPPALPAGKGACLRLRRGLRACGRALLCRASPIQPKVCRALSVDGGRALLLPLFRLWPRLHPRANLS